MGAVFSGMRDARGRPALRVKVLAVLLVLGLATLAAPLLVPAVRWVASGVTTLLF